MKRIFYYILAAAIASGVLTAVWVYQKYIRKEGAGFVSVAVERGDIREMVKVRGEVVPEKDLDLEFPFSGRVEKIFVAEGQTIRRGDPLIKLETVDFEIERQRLNAVLVQSQTKLDKLIAGPAAEEIKVAETKVAGAETALIDARKNLVDKLRDAYTKSDDAVRYKVDQFISNARTSSPQLAFVVSDSVLRAAVESGRVSMETALNLWKSSVDALTMTSALSVYAADTEIYLNQVRAFLDNVALAINSAASSVSVTQATLDSWKSDVATARTNINTAVSNLTAAVEKFKAAESALALAKDQLSQLKAGARPEDIEFAEAQIEETKSQIAAVNEKIRKSYLYSPAAAKVVKIWFEQQELFRAGQPAISLSATVSKIQADVSELDIGKIRDVDGNEVLIKLDAFPGVELTGKVVFIEPKEVIKEGDRYYRVNVFISPTALNIRSGMSADLSIVISVKQQVLKIPEFAVQSENGRKFVDILEDGGQTRAEVVTGVSDGEFIEITSGLSEGQTVLIPSD